MEKTKTDKTLREISKWVAGKDCFDPQQGQNESDWLFWHSGGGIMLWALEVDEYGSQVLVGEDEENDGMFLVSLDLYSEDGYNDPDSFTISVDPSKVTVNEMLERVLVSHSLVEGDRVKLVEDVDRYPNFVAPKGAVGTVWEVVKDDTRGDYVSVKMDDHIDGAEEWDNCVIWDHEFLDEIDRQVERVAS